MKDNETASFISDVLFFAACGVVLFGSRSDLRAVAIILLMLSHGAKDCASLWNKIKDRI